MERATGLILSKPIDLQPAQVTRLWQQRPKIFFRDVLDVTLDSWQEDVCELYMNNQRIGMVASKGPGKEQPVSNELYTPEGKRRFGDLKRGDEVFSEYGTPIKIKGTYPQGIKDVYKVTFDDGSFTECGLEHLWKVHGFLKGRVKKWGVLSLKEIMERGLFVTQGKQKHYHFQLPPQGAARFPYKKLSIDPYVLGVWLGDGSRRKGQFTGVDDEIQAEVSRRGYVARKSESKNRAPNIIVDGLFPKLKALGISDKYSYEKSIPEIYKTASIQQRKDLLKGLMDTYGTIDKKDSCMEYSTTSKELAEDVLFLVRSLGGKGSIKTKRSFLKSVEHRLCYRVRVTTDFNPFNLKRKAMYWKKPSQKRYLVRTFKNIELVRKEESMCIEVDCLNHCYLTNDFIVTHNTAVLALLGWHFFMTNHQPKIAALSVSKAHLMSNLWAELLKWRSQSKLLKMSTTDGQSKIALIGHEGYSFIDARAYPQQADETQMASALAGLHADNVGFLIDEAGSIPDSVLATADAALAGGESNTKKARLLVTANPEEPRGMLYRAYMGRTHQKWAIYCVSGDPDDPKRAARVSIDWAKEQIKTYGRDDPWVMVNVLGKYPLVSTTKLITEEEIHEAMKREIKEQEVHNSQLRLGVDVARGGIDSTAMAPRRGLKAYPIETISSNVFGPELAGKIAFMQQDKKIERVFVDNTGGFGSSVIDSLGFFPNLDVTSVVYNSRAQDKRYYNKRTEMWVRLRDWIKKGGMLPNDPGLAEELLMPKVFFVNGIFRLEEKEQIKARLGRSPDKADALAQTFADVEQPSFYAHFGVDQQGHRHRMVSHHISEDEQTEEGMGDNPNYSS